MTKQIALIGQSNIWRYKNGQKALSETIEKEIKNGYTHFIMALATDFDLVAYDACIALRKTYPDYVVSSSDKIICFYDDHFFNIL